LAAFGVDQAPSQGVKAVKVEVKAIPAQAVGEDAFLLQVEQQYAAQFRQLKRSELHFMRVVTEPTKTQYETIAAEAEPAMKAAVRAFAQSMRGIARDQKDPHAPLTEAIAKSVRAHLSPEQATRYQKELDLRVAARKRLVVNNLVAMIDRILILRPDQRDKLGEILND